MLYQTLPLLNSHTNPSSSSSSSSSFSFTDISRPLSRSQSLVSLRKMESVEMALKNSNQKEKTLNGGAQNGEDFSVDDLLNFSNDDVFSENDEAELKVLQPNDENTLHRNNDFSTAGEDLGSLPTSGLAVPMGDLPELEWLSKFVEETNQFFPTYSADPTKKPDWLTGNRKHPVPPVNEDSSVKPPLPIETRSKRARTGVRVWTDSSSSSATSSSSSSGPSSSNALCLSGVEFLDETMVKKQKKKKKKTKPLTQIQTLPQTQTQTETRKCGHCGVQSTPQWRTGPMGAKTLCNACGVRYKSGRLLPEYRPACSPSFSSELHSNHHRKVVEMRLKKVSDDADGTGLNQSV